MVIYDRLLCGNVCTAEDLQKTLNNGLYVIIYKIHANSLMQIYSSRRIVYSPILKLVFIFHLGSHLPSLNQTYVNFNLCCWNLTVRIQNKLLSTVSYKIDEVVSHLLRQANKIIISI